MTQTKIQTEAEALENILAWSKERPGWQRDALRRLIVGGELTETDLSELVVLCQDRTLPVQPMGPEHASGHKAGAPTVSLRKMANVQNVNALASDQNLTFLPEGITIVYGDNGAGKSGYVRILKIACRARGRAEDILPNINVEEATGPQRAEIEYLTGAQVQNTVWESGQPIDGALAEVSVFDSRAANVHVEEANSLAYTPYPLKLLEQLVHACMAVKDKLDADISSLESMTPQSLLSSPCSLDTKVGVLINTMSKSTDVKLVETLAKLSDEDVARFSQLTSDFAVDPKTTANRLRAHKTKLGSLREKLSALSSAVSIKNAQYLKSLSDDLEVKSGAAKAASSDLFKDEPLDGIGSDAWQKLWEAARSYSVSEAYIDLDFPNIGEDSRCVLCQQELGLDATSRLQRFESFVQNKTQQEEALAQQSIAKARQEIQDSSMGLAEMRQELVFLSDELGNSSLAEAIRKFAVSAQWRLRGMLRANDDVDCPIPLLDLTALDGVVDAMEKRALALLADDESVERKALRAELDELKDRQWLAGLKDDVLAQVSRLAAIDKLKAAAKDARSNEVTAKATQLSGALITDRLRARFTKEIDRLHISDLAVELTQARSQQGVPRFKIGLVQNKSQNTGEIFSEGEYRCVALAGFLAELATNNSGSGIVFDDPVSSLDHVHREAIAKRLATEGKERQVIVFTHDLPFLITLRNACTQVDDPSQKTAFTLRHIQKRHGEPGYCRNEAPDKAQDGMQRLQAIRKHLANTRIQYETDPDGTDWLITARGLIDSLRQTWEAAVGDAISPVLRTFSSRVDTKGFVKLSAISVADAEAMRSHYGQCSEWLHKTSDELHPSAPPPTSIEAELNALEEWLKDVTDRQKSIKAA